MKSELIDVSSTRKEIKIEIDPDLIRQTYDRISDRFAKQANVPGFRRGHAPKGVVRTRFKNEIRGQVLRELVPDAVNQAIEQHQLAAIGEPDIHFDDEETFQRSGDHPISLRVDVEVLPQIELSNYKGIPLARRVKPVTDEDVEGMIKAFRESSASLLPVEDRGAELGDTVTADFLGKFVDNPDEADIDVKDVELVLAGEGVQPEFNENLLGIKPDEERNFLVSYPADFQSEGLAGKRVQYTAKVTAVRVKDVPAADDDWARSVVQGVDSIEMLRGKVRQDLEEMARQDSDRRLRTDVLRQLLKDRQFEVPDSLVKHQTSNRLQQLVRDLIGRGVDPRNQALDWEGARTEMRAQAEDDVRASLLLELIVKEEKIEVSEDEINEEIEHIASATRQPVEQVNAILTKEGGKRSIANRLRNRKALDLLIQYAQVTDGEWREDESKSNQDSPPREPDREGNEGTAKMSSSQA